MSTASVPSNVDSETGELRPTQAAVLLGALRGGAAADELSLEVGRAILALQASENPKAKASVTLTIEIQRHPKNEEALFFDAEVKAKLPPAPRSVDILFADDNGNLSTTSFKGRKSLYDGPKAV